jgi:hypothetical protein
MCFVDKFRTLLHRRFGRDRSEVLLDAWHVYAIVCALAGEGGKVRRILSDLNEEYRLAQSVDHVKRNGTTDGFRPWVLVPVREP